MELSGFKVKMMDRTASTQAALKKMLNNVPMVPWPLIITDEQTAGRGLGKNRWASEAGKNLTFSFAWFPDFLEASDQFRISKAVSLAVCDVLQDLLPGEAIRVKWPNDIYVENRKIAGILIEHSICDRSIVYSLIGLGLNVNQMNFSADLPNPTSLHLLTGKQFELSECLKWVCGALQDRYLQLERDARSLDADYLKRLYRRDVLSDFIYQEKQVQARITGVNEFGQLELELADKTLITCSLKEIVFK
jgi:BirA family biotin operon repressor/biotin-[acetyl-CoA-carboxylase] ligase